MGTAFDPYHKWLGIPPEEQPANHYRLLGIKLFEGDPDVIANAADQRMAHLRACRGGQHAEFSPQLLNEVAAARLCLLHEQRKAEYDRALRQERLRQGRRSQRREPEDLVDPLDGLLDEQLTAGPALGPGTAQPAPATPMELTEDRQGFEHRVPPKANVLHRFVRARWLMVLVLVAAIVILLWYGMDGRFRTAGALMAIALFVIAIGFIPRSEEFEPILAGVLFAGIAGLLVLGVIINWAWLLSLDPRPHGWLALMLEVMARALVAAGIFGFILWLCARFGFHNTLGWCYVSLIVVLPIATHVVLSLPEGSPLRRLVAAPSRRAPPPSPVDPRPPAPPVSQGGVRFEEAGTMATSSRDRDVAKREIYVRDASGRRRGRLWLYVPTGRHPRHAVACVLIAPAGSNMMTGKTLTPGDEPEHLPYVRAGFAVLAYELEGEPRQRPDGSYTARELTQGMRNFWQSGAGLENARHAIEYLVQKVPEVDPNQLYTAGHSSAGTVALLVAMRDVRIRGCLAYAPATDLEAELGVGEIAEAERLLPGAREKIKQSSPRTHEARLRCPVFLFHARTDPIVPARRTIEFADRLKEKGKKVTLELVDRGDHYQPMISQGIAKGIEWLRALGAPSVTPKSGVVAPGPVGPTTVTRKVFPKPTSWTVRADRGRTVSVRRVQKPVSLDVSPEEIRELRITTSAFPRAVVLCQRAPGKTYPASHPERSIRWYNLQGSSAPGTLGLPGQEELAAVDPHGRQVLTYDGTRAAVWSLGDRRAPTPWQFSPAVTSHVFAQAAFLDTRRAVTLHRGHGLSLWNLATGDAVYTMESVECMALSPGGRYVVALQGQASQTAGYVLEATSGSPCGRLPGPTQAAEPWKAGCCAFDPQTEQLAALGGGRIVVWDLKSGDLQAEFAVEGVAEADRLDFLGDRYLYAEHRLIDVARHQVVWQYDFPAAARTWGVVPDPTAGRVWLSLPNPVEPGTVLSTVNLLATEAKDRLAVLPPVASSDEPPLGRTVYTVDDVMSGGTAGRLPGAQTAREYVRRTYVDLIAGDPAALVDRLRWCPATKRPTIGLRWGLGVYWSGQADQPRIADVKDLANLTGPVGPRILKALNQRAAEGRFGAWPRSSDPRLYEAVLLGSGTRAVLLETAAKHRLDLLVSLEMDTKAVGLTGRIDVTLRVKLVDVATKQPLWSSTSLSSNRLRAAGTGAQQVVDAFINGLMEQIEANHTLEPMPAIRPEHVERRIARLPAELPQGEHALPVLVELRYYQARQLATVDDLEPLLDRILGAGKGRLFATGDAPQRREVLEAWLSSL